MAVRFSNAPLSSPSARYNRTATRQTTLISFGNSTRALLFVMAATAVRAQSTSDPAIPPTLVHRHKAPGTKQVRPVLNTSLVVLDPGHGGLDAGAALGDKQLEKDVTVAFAGRLRDLLTARGFTVLLTHESAADDASQDQRAEVANRSHPLACLLLHAANGGHGVHLFTSSLTPVTAPADDPKSSPIVPWDSAQTAMLASSAQLASQLVTALNAARTPVILSRVSVRPMDSITSPAVALELSPSSSVDGHAAQVGPSDAAYQQRVAEAVVSALVLWRSQALVLAAAQTRAQTQKTSQGTSVGGSATSSRLKVKASPAASSTPASDRPATTPRPATKPKSSAPAVPVDPTTRSTLPPQAKGPRP